MTRYLIDSDCAVYAMTGQFPKLRERLAACEPGEVSLSAVSLAEMMLGTVNGKPPPINVLERFTSVIPVLAFDEAAARAHAAMPFKRARFDRLIAAHALSLGAVIVTNNESDFADLPSLSIENWTV